MTTLTKTTQREKELMEIMWHLTKDLSDYMEKHFNCGDEQIEELTRLSAIFNDNFYSDNNGTFLEQLKEFESRYLNRFVWAFDALQQFPDHRKEFYNIIF